MNSEHSNQVTAAILCGSSGTDVWPLSRTGFSEQFLCLSGKERLSQQAASRPVNLGIELSRLTPPIIVNGEDQGLFAAEQLREVNIEVGCALLEPVGGNTAPAITSATKGIEGGASPVMVVTSADQTVVNSVVFTSTVQHELAEGARGIVVILGVTPDEPETGYGYIRITESSCAEAESNHTVQHFVEKPNAGTAQTYLNEGGHYWNAGMFVLKASVCLKALEQSHPDILQTTKATWDKCNTESKFVRPGKTGFAAIPPGSIDYAAMEHCPDSRLPIKIIPLDVGWNDLGAWNGAWNVSLKCEAGNAHLGDVPTTDSRNTLEHATSRLVSLVGVENLIVVETPDAVLMDHKPRSQKVKHCNNIDEGGRFKATHIQIKPKVSLSLQKQHHRAGHWMVVSETAGITNGEKIFTLTENQSTYIPLGEVHRLANPGAIPLEIIEIQSGSYLGEDDIVRFEVTYGRAQS